MLKDVPRHYRIIGSVSFAALALITLLLFHSYREAVTLLEDQFIEQQKLINHQTARSVEDNIRQLIREGEILSRMPAIVELDLEESRNLMIESFEKVKVLHVNDISRTDADGIVRLTVNSPNLRGMDFSYRKYFKVVRERLKSIPVFEFLTFKGFRQGEKGILIAMPVFRRDGEFAGSANFIVEVGNLLKEFVPPEGDGRSTWVIDEDGTILYHPRYHPGSTVAEISGGRDSFREFLEGSMAGGELRARYGSTDGSLIIATSHPVRLSDRTWSIIAETDEQVIQSLLGAFNTGQLLGMSMAALAVLFGGFALAVIVDRSRSRLQSEVHRREKGEDEFRYQEKTYQTILDNSPS